MATRPKTIFTLKLYVDLLRRVPRFPAQTTATELRTSLNETHPNLERRRVERALKDLCDNDLLIRTEGSKPYGYSWPKSNSVLAAPKMNQHESLLFLMAEKHLSSVLPQQLSSSLGPFFKHARDQLRVSQRRNVARDWLRKVEIVSPTMDFIPPKVNPTVLKEVTSSLYANKVLEIRYRNNEDVVNNHIVQPLGLVQKIPFLYLVAYYQGNTERAYTFALHRMMSAESTTIDFERPNFDLQQYCREDRYMFGSGKKITLDFYVTRYIGRQLRESPLSEDQEIEKVGDEYHVRATVYESLKLDNFIASLNDEIQEVKRIPVEPDEDTA